MASDLRERVIHYLETEVWRNTRENMPKAPEYADAIIALVLEEAARVAADFVHYRLYQGPSGKGFPTCSYHSRDIADAIRALAGEAKDG